MQVTDSRFCTEKPKIYFFSPLSEARTLILEKEKKSIDPIPINLKICGFELKLALRKL